MAAAAKLRLHKRSCPVNGFPALLACSEGTQCR
eukprot:SAG31_NODE_45211_length_259_cov_1.606250_1_plen_32_part_10